MRTLTSQRCSLVHLVSPAATWLLEQVVSCVIQCIVCEAPGCLQKAPEVDPEKCHILDPDRSDVLVFWVLGSLAQSAGMAALAAQVIFPRLAFGFKPAASHRNV